MIEYDDTRLVDRVVLVLVKKNVDRQARKSQERRAAMKSKVMSLSFNIP